MAVVSQYLGSKKGTKYHLRKLEKRTMKETVLNYRRDRTWKSIAARARAHTNMKKKCGYSSLALPGNLKKRVGSW